MTCAFGYRFHIAGSAHDALADVAARPAPVSFIARFTPFPVEGFG